MNYSELIRVHNFYGIVPFMGECTPMETYTTAVPLKDVLHCYVHGKI